MNREDIVEVKDFKVQRIENPTKEVIESVWEKIHVLSMKRGNIKELSNSIIDEVI